MLWLQATPAVTVTIWPADVTLLKNRNAHSGFALETFDLQVLVTFAFSTKCHLTKPGPNPMLSVHLSLLHSGSHQMCSALIAPEKEPSFG